MTKRFWQYLRKALPTRLKVVFRGFINSVPMPTHLSWGWWLDGHDSVSDQVRSQDGFERGEQNLLERFLRPGMTVLDVGAHHGFHTLLVSKKVGPDGLVVSFEPSPREHRRLRWHLLLNGCRNVRAEAVALGSSEGTAEFYVCLGRETGCNSLRPPEVSERVRKVRVRVTTLDQYMKTSGIHAVDFVKLDVEGAELDVLRGAACLLGGSRPPILCELADVRTEPWGYGSTKIYDLLRSHGYHWFSITSDGGLQPCTRKQHFHENLVAVPEERLAAVGILVTEPGELK